MRTIGIKYRLFAIGVFGIALILSVNKVYAGLDKKHNEAGLVYWHGDIGQPKIALTFDDGPNEPYTLEILDILKKYNVKATFFVIGKNVERYPDIARRIVKEGHVIGNHTYDHPYLLLQTKSHIKYEIQKAEQAIVAATNIRPHLFRSPYGVDNSWIYHTSREFGYVTIEWSVTGSNGGKEIPPDKITKKILSEVKNGSIILIHPEKTVNLAYLASIKWFHRNPTFSEVSVISSLSSLYEKLSKLVKNIGMPRNDVVGSPVIEGAIFDKNLRICRKLQEGSRRNPYLKPLISPFFQVHDGDRLIRGANRRNIVKVLPFIIESLQQKGYQFVTVQELLGL